MLSTLQSLKTQFAESPTIVGRVDDKCSFVIELQQQKPPFISYNLREEGPATKDGSSSLDLSIAVVSKNITELIEIYDDVKTVMDNETTDFLSTFIGSSYPDTVGKDDHYIIELSYNIQTH